MYEEFMLNESEISIRGYEWKLAHPDYVVCLVHGIGEHAGRYDRIGEVFQAENIAMVGMDLRGHGYSSGKRGHTAPRKDILTDIDQLIKYSLDKYENIPIIIYGHSMGGNITLDYRKRGKMRDTPVGYLVTSPWIILERKIPDYLYLFVEFMSKVKPDFQIKTNITAEMRGNMEIILKEKQQQLMHGKISVKTAIESFEIGKKLMDGTLEQIGDAPLKPLLLMHGDADKSCSPEGSRKVAQLENGLCKYIEWKGLYHEIHNGNSTDDGMEVIETMVEWIKGF